MTKNLNHVAGFPNDESFLFPLLRMEISEIRSTLTISLYPHILKLKGTYELINYITETFYGFFRLELEEAKKHKSNQMEYDALAKELLTRIKIEKLLKESHIRQWIPGS